MATSAPISSYTVSISSLVVDDIEEHSDVLVSSSSLSSVSSHRNFNDELTDLCLVLSVLSVEREINLCTLTVALETLLFDVKDVTLLCNFASYLNNSTVKVDTIENESLCSEY